MAQVINTNSLSLITQNNMNKSQSAMSTAIERLSSGLRINSAKDDAAGQAIANRFTSNINGLTQASRNANDGISLAQTTEGSLSEINNNLQRIRELAVQAQNGTNSDSDLTSIQDEINQRLSEIDRVSDQTQFNGKKVLSENATMKIQVGANDGETISINLQKMDSESLKLKDFSVTGISQSLSELTDTSTTATDGVTTKTALNMSAVETISAGATVHGVGTAAANGTYSDYVIKTTDGKQFKGAVDGDGAVTFATVTAATIATDPQYNPTGATGTASPLKAIDDAIKNVDSFRSQLGAVQNRLDSAITNLGNTTTNLSAAQSRIQDADYATEVSNMSKAQIVQQAGNSVLAKANQVPQQVMSLLQG